jgi:hypothetical protein
MKRWILALVLGVPALAVTLLLAFGAVTVLAGIGDPLQAVLGPLQPRLTLAVWMWLAGLGLALAALLAMAWFAPWGVLFGRRPPRKRFLSEREGER